MLLTPDGSIRTPRRPRAAGRITMGVNKLFTAGTIIGDDEGDGQEFESHTGLQAALMLLTRRDVVSSESQFPLDRSQSNEEGGGAEIRKTKMTLRQFRSRKKKDDRTYWEQTGEQSLP